MWLSTLGHPLAMTRAARHRTNSPVKEARYKGEPGLFTRARGYLPFNALYPTMSPGT